MQKKMNEVQKLLTDIESSLNWGDSSGWSPYDFEKLSDLIFENTKNSISSNTLERIWGRIPYRSMPSDMTLNILSQFLGFDDFRGFLSGYKENPGFTKIQKHPKAVSRKFWPSLGTRTSAIFVLGTILILIVVIAMSYNSNIDPNDFYFTSRKVTSGLPNSVIFEYRADKAPAGAKVEIQQSWDARKRQEVSITDSLATAIYYQPGFFKSKLVVDNQIVKEHDILIPSDGWSASTEKEGSSLYFEKSKIEGDTAISVSKELLLQNGIDANFSKVIVDYRLVENFDGLRLDDLNFSVTIKNELNGSQNLCQKMAIVLLLGGQIISIPLSKLGCISELELWLLDKMISGKNRDMSRFGVDLNDWVTLDLTSQNDKMTLFVNGEEAINLPLVGKINRFYGFVFRFDGIGGIRKLKLSNSKRNYLDLDYTREPQANQDTVFNNKESL